MSKYDFNTISPLNYNYGKTLLNRQNNTINEYEKKAKMLQQTFASLIQLNNNRKIENEKNKIIIKKEIENSLIEMKNEIQNHKIQMIRKIDDCFSQIQNNIICMRNNKKLNYNNIYEQIQNLKLFLQKEIPKIYDDSNQLNIQNKENINNIKKEVDIELNNIKNNIYENVSKLKENEKIMSDQINNQIQEIIQMVNQIKKKREEYEENMFEQINDFIIKMKYALG